MKGRREGGGYFKPKAAMQLHYDIHSTSFMCHRVSYRAP